MEVWIGWAVETLVVYQDGQTSLFISKPELKIALQSETGPAVALMPVFTTSAFNPYCVASLVSSRPRGNCHLEDADEGWLRIRFCWVNIVPTLPERSLCSVLVL